MNKLTENLEKDLNATTKLFLDAFHELTIDELNWRPDKKSWSIAQVIQHLTQVADSYIPIIEEIENLKLPVTSKIPSVPKLFGKMLLKSVEPSRKRKVKTFSIWKPVEEKINEDVLYKFSKKKHQLILLLKKQEKHIENTTLIHSPANKKIVYSLENAFKIIINHEKRHFNQAKELINKKIESYK